MLGKIVKLDVKDGYSRLDQSLSFHRGDGDIELHFMLNGVKLLYSKSPEYDFKVVDNVDREWETTRLQLEDNVAKLTLDKAMIDEIVEVGFCRVQLRLWNGEHRIALPTLIIQIKEELNGSITLLRLISSEDGLLLTTEDGRILRL